jgi:hypothetical protein
MTILGVSLEKSTLKEAQRRLGTTTVRDNGGDAGANASGECYVGPDGTTLAFVSHGEMGGGTRITSYQLVAEQRAANYSGDPENYEAPVRARPRCARLADLSATTATGGGLRLGMSASDIVDKLGPPDSWSADELHYSSQEKRADPAGTDRTWSQGRSIRVVLVHARVVGLIVEQITVDELR